MERYRSNYDGLNAESMRKDRIAMMTRFEPVVRKDKSQCAKDQEVRTSSCK